MTFVTCVAVLMVACVYGAAGFLGGNETYQGQFPYYAIVKSDVVCGGSIINARYVYTAANCLKSINPKDYTITVGTNSLSSGGTVYKATMIIPNRWNIINFNSPKFRKHGFGFVKVQGNITFNDFVKPIQLASAPPAVGDFVGVIGFSSAGRNEPPVLQFGRLVVVDLEKCKEYFKERNVDKDMICTLEQRGAGVCFGGSGHPLVNSKGEQVGINIFAPAECDVEGPYGFLSVTSQKYFFGRALRQTQDT